MTLSELRKKREKMSGRRRRIVFNNDGDEGFLLGSNALPDPVVHEPGLKRTVTYPMTRKGLLELRTTGLLGSHVDAIWYWGSAGMKLVHQSGPFGRLYSVEKGRYYQRALEPYTKLMAECGKDNLQIMIDFCREHGLEIFYSNRMNDIHESFRDGRMQVIKIEHPDWCLGTKEEGRKYSYPDPRSMWSAMNFAIPQIRQLTVQALCEVCQNYDIDGIELDFWRHLINFPEMVQGECVTPEHLELINQMMRDIRTMTEEEGLKRGHPILLAGRCVEDIELSRNSGLDVETWLEEDLVDILSMANATEHTPPIDSLTKLADRYGVPVYPILNSFHMAAIEAPDDMFGNLPVWRGDALNKFAQGAAGLQAFNLFDTTRRQWWELGEPELLLTLDRTYVWDYLPSQRKGRDTFGALRVSRHRPPVTVTANGCEPMPLYVGEDLSAPDGINKKRKLTLCVRAQGLTRQHDLAVAVNGKTLRASTLCPKFADAPAVVWLYYEDLSGSLFKKGENWVTAAVKRETGEPAKIDQVRLDVRYAE